MKNYFVKGSLLLLFLPLLALTAKGQISEQKFVQETHYILYLPEGYSADDNKEWPLVLFLHGAGEVGTDLNQVAVHGPIRRVKEGKQFPFIVIAPQTPTHEWKPEALHVFLSDFIKNHKVDKERVYLTGLSMGGYGTWAFAQMHPEMFAAIIPICGGGDPSKAWTLTNMPVWCFHNEGDHIVPVSESRNMIDALKPMNPNVKYTEYPVEGHGSWQQTYENDEVYKWMLEQKRYHLKQASIDPKILARYEGKYQGDVTMKNIILNFKAIDGKLMATNQDGNSFPVTPASETLFFVDIPDIYAICVFVSDANGKVTEILIHENGKQFSALKTE